MGLAASYPRVSAETRAAKLTSLSLCARWWNVTTLPTHTGIEGRRSVREGQHGIQHQGGLHYLLTACPTVPHSRASWALTRGSLWGHMFCVRTCTDAGVTPTPHSETREGPLHGI